MEDLIYIGTPCCIVRETERAVLFSIGTSNSGNSIERFIPKSQLYQRGCSVYVPKWLARKMGIWNHSDEKEYCRRGYTKMYDTDDDLPF